MKAVPSSFLTEQMREELTEVVGRGIQWLLSSGVREGSSSGFLSGGVRAQSSANGTGYCPIYSEITGYAAQFFLWLYEETKVSQYFDTALQASDFLLRIQCDHELREYRGAFPYGVDTVAKRSIEQYFTFDSGICASALVDVYRKTGEQKYLRAAMECGRWLLSVQRTDGSFPALVSPLPEEKWAKTVSGWYGDSSAIHGKLAITFLKLWELTEDEAYYKATLRLLTWLSRLQNTRGCFQASESVSDVVTHAHCYAIEGLLYAADRIGNSDLDSMARRGGKRLLEMQNGDGSYYKFYFSKEKAGLKSGRLSTPLLRRFVRPLDTGATAQASRILLCSNGWSQEDVSAIERSIRFLLSMQSTDRRESFRGGFHARLDKLLLLRRAAREFYPWTSMFALQFLMAVLRTAPRLETWEIF